MIEHLVRIFLGLSFFAGIFGLAALLLWLGYIFGSWAFYIPILLFASYIMGSLINEMRKGYW